MFGLGPLISLAIYAGIAAVALGAIYGFDKSRQNVGREAQRLENKPVMALCEQYPATGMFSRGAAEPAECARRLQEDLDRGKEATTANVTLAAALDAQDGQIKACKGAVARIEGQVAATKAAIAARKPGDDKAIAAIATEKDALLASLATVGSKARTCEQELAERNAAWTAEAVRRQRDFPQTGAPQPTGDVNIRPPAASRPAPTNPLAPK